MSPFSAYDRIVVHTCKSDKNRWKPLQSELKRIGIDAEFQICDESAHANVQATLQDVVNNPFIRRVLCFEDDIRFLKDADEVYAIFNSAPNDECDICSFDNFLHLPQQLAAEVRREKGWMKYNRSVFGASCWSFNRRAAEILLRSYLCHPNEPPDSQLFMNHQDLRSSFHSIPACIQVFYKGCQNDLNGWREAHHAGYYGLKY